MRLSHGRPLASRSALAGAGGAGGASATVVCGEYTSSGSTGSSPMCALPISRTVCLSVSATLGANAALSPVMTRSTARSMSVRSLMLLIVMLRLICWLLKVGRTFHFQNRRASCEAWRHDVYSLRFCHPCGRHHGMGSVLHFVVAQALRQ